MTKKEFARIISTQSGVAASEVEKVLSTMGISLGIAFSRNESVFLRGFGTFKLVERAERKAQNILSGTTITIPAHRTPVLKFSEEVQKWAK